MVSLDERIPSSNLVPLPQIRGPSPLRPRRRPLSLHGPPACIVQTASGPSVPKPRSSVISSHRRLLQAERLAAQTSLQHQLIPIRWRLALVEDEVHDRKPSTVGSLFPAWHIDSGVRVGDLGAWRVPLLLPIVGSLTRNARAISPCSCHQRPSVQRGPWRANPLPDGSR